MGKTSKPLHIVVDEQIIQWPEIQALRDQGHDIECCDYELHYPDIILHRRAWRMDEDHREYLDLAIAEARKVRYPKEGKNDTTGDS